MILVVITIDAYTLAEGILILAKVSNAPYERFPNLHSICKVYILDQEEQMS